MNYKSFIVFTLFVLPQIYLSIQTFKCTDDLKVKTCLLRTKESNGDYTNYVKKCPKNKSCAPIDEDVSQCIKVDGLLEDGEKCKLNEECESKNCVDEKCSYISDGGKCTGNFQCGKSSYCKSSGDTSSCAPLVGKDGTCVKNSDCKFGLLCNGRTLVCTEMFSLNDGEVSNNDLLCKSGKVFNIGNNGQTGYVCASTKTVNSTCTQVNSNDNTYVCGISYNIAGTDIPAQIKCDDYGYCPVQSDSNELKEYIKVFQEELKDLSDDDINDIHVSTSTRKLLGNNKKVTKAYVNFKYFYQIGDNDDSDCIRDYFIRYEKSSFIFTSFVLLFTFILLLI